MARKVSPVLTDAERDIMAVLWEHGRASARDVLDVLERDRKIAFTTVQTMLKVLEGKGHARADREGRALIYRPILSREAARSRALEHLVDGLFGGSRKALAMHIASSIKQDGGDLQSLLEEIDRAEKAAKD